MAWVTDADLELWQECIDRGEWLDVDECRHLLAEVRRLRQLETERDAYVEGLLDRYSQCAQDWLKEQEAADRLDAQVRVLAERLAWYEGKLESLTL